MNRNNIAANDLTDTLLELADQLNSLNFPIQQLPISALEEILKTCFGNGSLFHVHEKMLHHFLMNEDSTGCALQIQNIVEEMKFTKQNLYLNLQKNAEKIFIKKVLQRYKHNSCFTGKGVIYTVLTGNYESLKEPLYKNPEFDYICFTDMPSLQSKTWTIRVLENAENLNSIRLSRKPKILCHQFLNTYDYSIYVDAKFRITGDLKAYLERYSMGQPMLCFPHYLRDCIYEEAKVCISLNKDNKKNILKQIKRYREEGFPSHYGLIDAGCMVRSHNNVLLKRTMENWWDEFVNGSQRDQLSFPYACWKNQLEYDICSLYSERNEYLHLER